LCNRTVGLTFGLDDPRGTGSLSRLLNYLEGSNEGRRGRLASNQQLERPKRSTHRSKTHRYSITSLAVILHDQRHRKADVADGHLHHVEVAAGLTLGCHRHLTCASWSYASWSYQAHRHVRSSPNTDRKLTRPCRKVRTGLTHRSKRFTPGNRGRPAQAICAIIEA